MELANAEESVDMMKNDESQSFVDILGDFRVTDATNFKFSDLLNDLNEWPDESTDDTIKNVKLEKLSDCEMENSCDGVIRQRPEIASFFDAKEQRPWPWLKQSIAVKGLQSFFSTILQSVNMEMNFLFSNRSTFS